MMRNILLNEDECVFCLHAVLWTNVYPSVFFLIVCVNNFKKKKCFFTFFLLENYKSVLPAESYLKWNILCFFTRTKQIRNSLMFILDARKGKLDGIDPSTLSISFSLFSLISLLVQEVGSGSSTEKLSQCTSKTVYCYL